MTTQNEAALRTQALEVLTKFKSRAIHVGELRSRVGLEKTDYDRLAGVLDRMADEGLVTQLPGGRYRLRREGKGRAGQRKQPGSSQAGSSRDDDDRSRVGNLTINMRGFGFVSVDGGGPDVFIPASRLGTAMHGDRVKVRVQFGPKGLDGRVVEILERRFKHVGGQLHITPAGAFIEADDDRVRLPIHVVGDVPKDARTGQGVIAEVVSYPERLGDRLEVEIVETFDPHEFVAFETRRVLLREGAPQEFSEEALAEARALPNTVPTRDKRDRVDLRKLPLVTIDPDDAKDHDDAVWAERQKDGSYRVIVAIADVSHYVRPGSAVDADAKQRGVTIYLPGHSIPMLPAEISSNLASLVPNRDRLALAVEVILGPAGAIRSHRLLETVMRSHARITYAGAARALGLTEDGPDQPKAVELLPMLQTLLKVSQLLGKRRRRRGSLAFDLPEAKVKIDSGTGRPVDVLRSREDPGLRAAYKMIEELALLANEVVAADLSKRKLPTIYRIHPTPDLEKLEAFAALANSLGHNIDAESCQNPQKLERFLTKIADTEHAETMGYLLLRAMQQATYNTDNVGHFGLAAKDYVHFTSPIRRYPDLAVHRTVRQIARGERIDTRGMREELATFAETSSLLERRAMGVEREVVDLYRAMLMQERVGEEFSAQITGVGEHGIFVALQSPYVDVMIRTPMLPRDRYELDPFGIRLTGMYTGRVYRLGDHLQVRIEDVSLARRRISGVLVEADEVAAAAGPPPPADAVRDQGRGGRRRPGRQDGKRRDDERRQRRRGPRQDSDAEQTGTGGARHARGDQQEQSEGPAKRGRRNRRGTEADERRSGGRRQDRPERGTRGQGTGDEVGREERSARDPGRDPGRRDDSADTGRGRKRGRRGPQPASELAGTAERDDVRGSRRSPRKGAGGNAKQASGSGPNPSRDSRGGRDAKAGGKRRGGGGNASTTQLLRSSHTQLDAVRGKAGGGRRGQAGRGGPVRQQAQADGPLLDEAAEAEHQREQARKQRGAKQKQAGPRGGKGRSGKQRSPARKRKG